MGLRLNPNLQNRPRRHVLAFPVAPAMRSF